MNERRRGRDATQLVGRFVADRPWVVLGALVYALTVVVPQMDRFFTWDEAVFWSQSGGLDGARVVPLPLVASREMGSSAFIAFLRLLGDSIAEVRFLWATVAFTLLLVGARRLRKHIGNRSALLFFGIYSTYWLVLTYTPMFYANVLGAAFGLLAATFYLDMIREGGRLAERSPTWLYLGLSGAGMFALRPVESVLVAVGLAAHFLIFHRAKFRTLARKGALAIATVLITIGIPWVIDSSQRFGSVAGRIRAGFTQSGQVASGPRVNVADYLGAATGDSLTDVASFTRGLILLAMALAVIAIVLAFVTSRDGSLSRAPGLLALLGLCSASYFLFWRADVNERYLFPSMIFAVALFAWAFFRIWDGQWRSWTITTAVVTGLLWLVVMVTTVVTLESEREIALDRTERVGLAMRTLAQGTACSGWARFGAPQLRVASGCLIRSYADWEWSDLVASDDGESTVFIYGRTQEDDFKQLPEGWETLTIGSGPNGSSYRLAYRLPGGGS